MRRAVALVVVFGVCALLLPREAGAEAGGRLPPIAGSVNGGNVDITPRGALSVGLGWPSVYAQYDFPTSSRFGIGLRGDFYYGMPAWEFDFGLGFGVDVPMRIEVLDRGNWNLALHLDAGVFLGLTEDWVEDFWWREDEVFFIGPNLGFGLMASVQPVPALNIFFGLRVPIFIFILVPDEGDTQVKAFGQIQFNAGVEFSVARNIALYSRLALGPSIGSFCDRFDEHDHQECADWDIDARFSFYFHFGATFYFGGSSSSGGRGNRRVRRPSRSPTSSTADDSDEEDGDEEEEDDE